MGIYSLCACSDRYNSNNKIKRSVSMFNNITDFKNVMQLIAVSLLKTHNIF